MSQVPYRLRYAARLTELEVPFICIEHIVNLAVEGLVLWRKNVVISLNIVIFNLCKRDLKDRLIYNMQI